VQWLRTFIEMHAYLRPSTSAHKQVAVARSSLGADVCVFIATNPITSHLLSPIIVAGEVALLPPTNDASFYDPFLDQHLDLQRAWIVETRKEESSVQSPFAVQEQIHTTVAIVLRREQKFGILYLHFREQVCQEDFAQRIEDFAMQYVSYVFEFWQYYHYSQIEAIKHAINHTLTHVEDLFTNLRLYLSRVLDHRYSLLLAVYTWQGDTFDTFVNEGEQIFTGKNLSSADGACRYAIETEETLSIKPWSREKDSLPYLLAPVEGTQPKESFIFIPLILRGDISGVLSLQHAEPDVFGEQDLLALKLLADHIALALRNISLYNNLQRLNKTGGVFLDLLDSAKLLPTVVQQIQEDTQANVVVLYPYDATLQKFVLPPLIAGELLSSKLSDIDLRHSDNIVHLVMQQEKAIFARDSRELYGVHLQGDLNIRQRSFVVPEAQKHWEYIIRCVLVALSTRSWEQPMIVCKALARSTTRPARSRSRRSFMACLKRPVVPGMRIQVYSIRLTLARRTHRISALPGRSSRTRSQNRLSPSKERRS
jgi:GAF domain-containing protein